MNRFEFSLEPPRHWEQHCVEHGALFHTPVWQSLLERAFGSQTIYGWQPAAEIGFALSVFGAGPFRIGYLGFPVGGTIGTTTLDYDTVMGWKAAYFPVPVHCLRVPVSGFAAGPALALPRAQTPETAILALGNWEVGKFPKLRRDIHKARRSPTVIRELTDPLLGDTFHRLYRATVTRHGGQLRYNEPYFRGLIELSREHRGLRCLTAMLDEEVAGFVVVALHGKTAYYLHGASDTALMRYGASDLLLHEAIMWAKTQSADCFNLMTSPREQASLIRYKEKWGGQTRAHTTYTLPIRGLVCAGFRALERIYRLAR